jgi:hypothetical protein
MTEPRTTTDFINEAERRVGPELERELAERLELAAELTNIAGSLVEEIENAPGDARAIHVSAFLLSRLITDLRSCVLLIKHGYAAQALSLTAGMLEMAHTSMYIGPNEERAQAWLAHANVKQASPWRLKAMIIAVAREMGVPDAVARREYEQIYNQACMAKHGHPIALGDVGLVSDESAAYIVAGPYLSDSVRRWSHVALMHGIRYTKLAAIKFLRDHLSGTSREAAFLAEMRRLTEVQQRLIHADAKEFGALEP